MRGTAGLVSFARQLDPKDMRNITHPAEYVTNLSNTAAGPLRIEGTLIETSNPKPLELYKPGEQLPDYSMFPAKGLDVTGRTVRHEVRLSQLLMPNMGRVHWSACRSIMKADTPLL